MEWEDTHVSLNPAGAGRRDSDPLYRQNFATLVIHYWANDCFLRGDAIMRDMDKLIGIPGILIHGRYDVSSPAITAWQLHQLWPDSSLQIIEDEDHGGTAMMDEMTRATNDLCTNDLEVPPSDRR